MIDKLHSILEADDVFEIMEWFERYFLPPAAAPVKLGDDKAKPAESGNPPSSLLQCKQFFWEGGRRFGQAALQRLHKDVERLSGATTPAAGIGERCVSILRLTAMVALFAGLGACLVWLLAACVRYGEAPPVKKEVVGVYAPRNVWIRKGDYPFLSVMRRMMALHGDVVNYTIRLEDMELTGSLRLTHYFQDSRVPTPAELARLCKECERTHARLTRLLETEGASGRQALVRPMQGKEEPVDLASLARRSRRVQALPGGTGVATTLVQMRSSLSLPGSPMAHDVLAALKRMEEARARDMAALEARVSRLETLEEARAARLETPHNLSRAVEPQPQPQPVHIQCPATAPQVNLDYELLLHQVMRLQEQVIALEEKLAAPATPPDTDLAHIRAVAQQNRDVVMLSGALLVALGAVLTLGAIAITPAVTSVLGGFCGFLAGAAKVVVGWTPLWYLVGGAAVSE